MQQNNDRNSHIIGRETIKQEKVCDCVTAKAYNNTKLIKLSKFQYMENELLSSVVKLKKNEDWYSEEFISQSVTKFLKAGGYKIQKEYSSDRGEKMICASRYFKKELIEVKGFPTSYFTSDVSKTTQKNSSTAHQARNWFSEALFNSFINFGNYYNNDNVIIAMALPDVERYKTIITRVQDYFTLNNLYFKIYLVNEDGDVEVSNLNESYLKQQVEK
jgi:predicted ribonuclease YlaK